MSLDSDRILKLTGVYGEKKSMNALVSDFKFILNSGIHGLCHSPYIDGQMPGEKILENQIRRRIDIIKPYIKWIRSYSTINGNELIPKIAKEYGLKTIVGAWLGPNEEDNEKEISNLIQVAKDGYADILVVGNEVMYREDMLESELLVYLYRVKNEVKNIPVGYVDSYDMFELHPKIIQACDIVLASCFPFWEGCRIDYSLLYLKEMYSKVVKTAKGKKVIIAATGWPNKGEEFYDAEPSATNALTYFLNIQQWAQQENIEVFYFSSFDEHWKMKEEDDLGSYWGLWNSNEKLKY